MAQHQSSDSSNSDSLNQPPALEALYNDLDAFINELGGDEAMSAIQARHFATRGQQLQRQQVSTLTSSINDSRDSLCPDEDSSYSGYSPLLENYKRPFSQFRDKEEPAPTSSTPPPVPPSSEQEEEQQSKDHHQEQATDSSSSSDDEDEKPLSQLMPTTAKKDNLLSPPVSPSLLGISPAPSSSSPSASAAAGAAVSQSKGLDSPTTPFLMPRTSSLTHQQQQQQQQQRSLPTSPTGAAVPSSATSATFTQPPLSSTSIATNAVIPSLSFPEHYRLSELGEKFIIEIRQLNEHRRMFCTAEYPLSFTGEEAVQIIESILPAGVPTGTALQVARAFMRTSPPLVGPISYSEKSLKRNTLYESANEIYTLIDDTIDTRTLPQSVLTPLTSCYTQFCLPGQGGCYAPCCPNRLEEDDEDDENAQGERRAKLGRQTSLKSVTSSHDTSFSRAWSANMPRDILQNTPEPEIKRQEAIHEIIYTEEDYVRDLNLLEELFATPLLTAQCLEPERRDEFCEHVFNNYKEILDIHRDLCRDLRDRQNACIAGSMGGFVDQVGDIFQMYLPRFMAAYEQYGPHVVLAEYAVKKEAQQNMLFANFVHDTEKQAECRKLPFRHFLILPVTRLQRYPLLMGAILKKTPDDHPDKAFLTSCCDMLREVASCMDQKTEETKKVLRLHQINDAIRYKPGEEPLYQQLQLLNPARRLLHEGPLTRRSHMGVETIDLHVFLFDHLLLMTKPKKNSSTGEVEYHMSKKPIPLPLLQVHEATEGFAIGLRSMSSTLSSTGTSTLQHSTTTTTGLTSPTGGLVSTSSNNSSSPMLIHHLGRHGGDYLLFAESSEVRMTWREKMVEAKAALEQAYPDNQVFEIRTLSDTTFAGSGAHNQAFNHGKVTCSIPFEGANGIRMIAIGTNLGVWMGMEGDTTSMRHVLSLSDITQMAVLEHEHILVILADKTLYAYALQGLDPNATPPNQSNNNNQRPSQKIAQHISYFHAGVCNNRTLVVAMKKRGMDSHFRAYEPVCGDLRSPQNLKYLTVKSGLFGSKQPPPWFHIYKEFYIGADSRDVHLLKARVVVVCSRGFEIIDPEHLNMNRNLPDMTHPDFASIFKSNAGNDDNIRPLGMFRCNGRYLLCYDTFAFLVDNHGGLVKNSWIEWEGNPQSIAFCYPYVVAFDPRFIEVRHAETGQLIQILAGEHMRCLQFTTQSGMLAPVIHGCMGHPFKPGYQYVFQLAATFQPIL